MWEAVRNHTNFRVVRDPGPKAEYHRGTDGAVRVYREKPAAEGRAAKLNEKENDQ